MKAKVKDFSPDKRNANKGTDRGREVLRASLEKLGAGRSILVDKHGSVIAGNKTREAAIALGLEDAIVVETDGSQLVVVKRTDLNLEVDAAAKELAIADNRANELGLEWDSEVIAELNQEIDLSSFFTGDELSNLTGLSEGGNGEDDEEAVAEEMEQADAGEIECRVQPGEIWQLGRHRIACADSIDEANVKALLGDRVATFVWADPPYGIKIQDKDGRVGGGKSGGFGKGKVQGAKAYPIIFGDETIEVASTSIVSYSSWFPKAVQIFWGANHYVSPPSSCWIVWDKKTERGDYEGIDFADAELAWTNQKTAVRVFRHLWLGAWKQSEVSEGRVHPTQKPIALAEWCFEKYGNPDDIVIDPFLGSGMSIIAAQKMTGSRTVYGFELSPEYCTVILNRWEKFTGGVAELAGHIKQG